MTPKIYKKIGNEVWIIPVVGNPPLRSYQETPPVIPHSQEKVDPAGLAKLRTLKSGLVNKLSLNL